MTLLRNTFLTILITLLTFFFLGVIEIDNAPIITWLEVTVPNGLGLLLLTSLFISWLILKKRK